MQQDIKCYQQALIINREIDHRRAEGIDLGNLGNAHYSLGYLDRAIEYYEQALAISREAGDKHSEENWLGETWT